MTTTGTVTADRPETPPGLEPWDLADPGALLEDLAGRVRLVPRRLIAARVLDPATDQRLLAATVVWRGLPELDAHRDLVEAGVARLGLEPWAAWDDPLRRRTSIVFVAVRWGRSWAGRDDLAGAFAFRYANNAFQVMHGETLIVTEHGWCLADDPRIAGRWPVAG